MILKRNCFVLFAVFCLLTTSCSKSSDEVLPTSEPPTESTLKFPRKEMRAAWIATVWELDWPGVRGEAAQKQKYIEILDRLQELKFNAVIFQIKGMGDAFYDSPYEPWSAAISGTRGESPGYDVLNFLIEETHARGIEFHAWINPYRIATRANATSSFAPLASTVDPSWVKDYADIRIYNPALPEVRQRLADIVKDIITKYDVDGIHIDDYFYPSSGGHNDESEFAQYGSEYSSIAAFRRGNVDKAIEMIYNTVKTNKPEVVFSVSPAADRAYSYNSLSADVPKWTFAGWVDILMPQLYQRIGNSANAFETTLRDWSQFRGKAKLVIGHALYRFGTEDAGFGNVEELENQFTRVKLNKYSVGSAMYSMKSIMENKIGITDKLQELYAKEVIMPFAGREVAVLPVTPSNVTLAGSNLSWAGDGVDIRYAVYYFSSLTAEGELVGVTTSTDMVVSKNGHYCVTALNEDHVESKASNTIEMK